VISPVFLFTFFIQYEAFTFFDEKKPVPSRFKRYSDPT